MKKFPSNLRPVYLHISFRCELEEFTSWVGYNRNRLTQFKTEAFKFISSNSLQVECTVRICFDTDQSLTCTFCQGDPNFRVARTDISESSLASEKVVVVKSTLFYITKKGKANSEKKCNN